MPQWALASQSRTRRLGATSRQAGWRSWDATPVRFRDATVPGSGRRRVSTMCFSRESSGRLWAVICLKAPDITVLWQDLRFGIRSLRKDHGFLLACVAALGLGIGSATRSEER